MKKLFLKIIMNQFLLLSHSISRKLVYYVTWPKWARPWVPVGMLIT